MPRWSNHAARIVSMCALWLSCLAAVAAAALPPPELAVRRASAFHLDYDGDGVADAVVPFGLPTDVGLVGDFDGDTLSDTALYRSGSWFISLYNDSGVNRTAFFGTASDIPLIADVNGDGLADLVLYRPSTRKWRVNYGQGGVFSGAADLAQIFGAAGDVPVVGDFDGDGRADATVYSAGVWRIDTNWDGVVDRTCTFGGLPGDVPLAGDFDGDGVADLVIFRAGLWLVDTNCDGVADIVRQFGQAGDRPLAGTFNSAQAVFVSPAVPKDGDGSQRAPIKKIAAALAEAPANAVIRLAAGTHAAPVVIANRVGLTLAGAGWTATHLTGGGGPGSDAVTIVKSAAITLRNLHVASPNQRGVIVQGADATLDRVSTVGTFSHGVLATRYLGTVATLSVRHSRLDRSQVGTGLRLEGGVAAGVLATSVSGNGTAPAGQIPPAEGRGVVVLGDSTVDLAHSVVSDNYDGGVLVDNTTSAVAGSVRVTDSVIEKNGTNGIIYGNNTAGLVARNLIASNGQRGSRGATTGFNGIELLSGWHGPSMIIKGNTIADNTGNGLLVGSGAVKVKNNTFDDNWLAMTIFNAPAVVADVVVTGNTFDTAPPTTNQTGIYIQETWGNPVVHIGGAVAAKQNVFKNYLGRPAIACEIGTAVTSCAPSWNQFVNSSVPVQKCSCGP